MKKISLSTLLIIGVINTSLACPVCERQQPKIFKGITHGAGPDGILDYIIIIIMVIITLITLFYSVKWLIRPNEDSKNHIKNSILNLEDHEK